MAVQGVEAIKVLVDQENNATNSIERYKNEWAQIVGSLGNLDMVKSLAINGDFKFSKFRSIHWALLLRVLDIDHNTWPEQRRNQRKRYEQLKQDFIKNPHLDVHKNDNPLSQSKQSVWNQYFSDQELFTVIRQDVVRTFPGVDFFRKSLIQSAMTNILFYYAREHPYMCYRQGMHEILAPILFVLYGDHQSLLHFMEVTADIDMLLFDVINPDYLEADSYSMFSRLMASIESYYRITNNHQTEGGYFPSKKRTNGIETITSEVEVIGHLNTIRDKILAKEDLHLHNYLLKLDIPLHIFGIRWLRLLFGREFPLLDLLVLWDAIFADSDRFDLPDYILVAMLIGIRDKLLLNDYTTCLTYLMRYPPNVDINLILQHALHMQNPKRFDRPENAFIYFTMNMDSNPTQITVPMSEAQKTTNSKTVSSMKKMQSNSTQLQTAEQLLTKELLSKQDTKITKPIAIRNRLKTQPESHKQIIDEFSENSSELLGLELLNAQTIIDIAKTKLQNYLKMVKRYTPSDAADELRQALDGIEEVCSFLDVKLVFPESPRTSKVDQAMEADENRPPRILRPPVSKLPNGITRPSLSQPHLPNVLTNYEKPDIGGKPSSLRLLGREKEVELVQIKSKENIENDLRSSLVGLPSIDPIGCRDD